MIAIKGKKYTTLGDIEKRLMKKKSFRDSRKELEFEFALIDALIRARIEKKMTQKELAKKMGSHQSAIARFESGKAGPTLMFAQKLAMALGLRIRVGA